METPTEIRIQKTIRRLIRMVGYSAVENILGQFESQIEGWSSKKRRKKVASTLHVGVNYGSIMETYGVQDVFDEINLDKRRPVVKMTGKEWLKTNRY
jgi:hypothetical protein